MSAQKTLSAVGRRGVLAATAGLLASPAIVRAQGQNGVALVIGNSKYLWEASLPNVQRDAPDVARRFEQLGLKTELLRDVGRPAMLQAIEKFSAAARGANFAAFYFAGHGVSWDNNTYLVPVDADLGNPSAVTARLDATDRFAQTTSAPNTLVLFSTAPGHTALDGPAGENSPFATAFLRQLGGESVDIKELAANLRRDVLGATHCRQLIWDQDTYADPFRLAGRAGRQAPAPQGPDLSAALEPGKAYAYTREKKLPLPSGLLMFRAADGPQGQKVGSFAFTQKLYYGNSTATYSIVPSVLVVMSVSDKTAEAVLSAPKLDSGTNYGVRWRFFTATLSDKSLEFVTVDGNGLFKLTWRDRNSGVFEESATSITGVLPYSSRFTRLD